ncbi:hypothetical protein CPC08DRAFT_731148 [Agrocybe pediades]|nr:hypothetical protein CPC08DRAFT_731148 [Agrocybe pediades]
MPTNGSLLLNAKICRSGSPNGTREEGRGSGDKKTEGKRMELDRKTVLEVPENRQKQGLVRYIVTRAILGQLHIEQREANANLVLMVDLQINTPASSIEDQELNMWRMQTPAARNASEKPTIVETIVGCIPDEPDEPEDSTSVPAQWEDENDSRNANFVVRAKRRDQF